jgi:ligand-binding sensor domain-containing protein
MRFTSLFTFLLCFSQGLSAQSSDSLIHYSVENGLASNYVRRAYQDSKGFMWFPTDRGITRFDGTRFKNYVNTDNNDLLLKPFAVGEDSHKRLWMYGTSSFFCYFDLEKNKFVSIKNNTDAPLLSYFTYIHEASPNKLIFYTSNNIIYELDENLKITSWKKNTQRASLTSLNYPQVNSNFSIFNYTKDSIYIQSKYANLPQSIVHYPTGYAVSRVYTDSAFFYVQGQQLGVFSHGKTVIRNIKDLTKNKDILNFQIFDTGSPKRTLVKTGKEFFVVDENLNRLTEFDFINNYTLNTIYFDKKDNLWLCTYEEGLFLKIREKKPSIAPVYLRNQANSVLLCDKKGNVLVGNNNGELFIFKDTIGRKVNIQNSPSTPLQQLFFDAKDNLFICWQNVGYAFIESSLLYKDTPILIENAFDLSPQNSKEPFYQDVKIPFINNKISLVKSPFVRYHAKNTEGGLIISVNRELRLLKVEGSYWTNSLIAKIPFVVGMSEIRKNDLWIVSSSLKRLSGDKLDKLDTLLAPKKKNSVLEKTLEWMLADKFGNLWASPFAVGLCYIDTSNFNTFLIPEMSEDYVEQTVLDEKNRIWVATNRGIVMVEVLSRNPFKYRLKRIDKTLGLASNEVISLSLNDSLLFAASTKGLSVLNIEKVLGESNLTKSSVKLHFSNLKINQKDTILRGSYDLRYDENNLEIDFAGLSFNPQNPIRYEYRMQKEGDAVVDWRTTNEPRLVFSFLLAGKYTLHVRAFDAENHVLEMAQPLVINVRLPFWKTGWFYATILAFLGLIAWILYKNNIERIKKEEAEKAEISRQFTVLELQALQAQINPHFVFNALTAIQNFIWNKDVKSANEYLTEFSTLMRLFLESSRRKYLTVEEEVKLLKIYVHLEQLRFPDRFDADFDIEENISTSDELPSMLIQPFVENAINHGLLYKKGKGLLQVHFSKENNILTCIVEDNGVGRGAAAAIRATSIKTHKSRATEILQERIALMKSAEGTEVAVSIEDKNVGENQDFGTKVLIEIKEI